MVDMPTSGDIPKKSGGKGIGRTLFWLIAAIVAVVLLYLLLSPNEGEEVNPHNSDVMMDEPVTTNYTFDQPEDWTGLERAETNIQDLAPGQTIEFGIVTDPTDNQVVYFASSVHDRPTNSNLVSVYKYRNDDYTFERLFRTTYEQGNPLGLEERILPKFHAVGYEDGHLILLSTDVNDTLENCESAYVIEADDKRSLFTLDLNDPYAGFKDYIPSQELLAQEKELTDSCLE